MYLNHFLTIQQILSGLFVSVVYWVFWIVRSNPSALHINIFSFKLIEETCTFMNISCLKYHLSVIWKQKIVLPCVNFISGARGYDRWDLMLTLVGRRKPVYRRALPFVWGEGGNCTHRLVKAIFREHFQGHYSPKIIITKGIIVSFIGNPGSWESDYW